MFDIDHFDIINHPDIDRPTQRVKQSSSNGNSILIFNNTLPHVYYGSIVNNQFDTSHDERFLKDQKRTDKVQQYVSDHAYTHGWGFYYIHHKEINLLTDEDVISKEEPKRTQNDDVAQLDDPAVKQLTADIKNKLHVFHSNSNRVKDRALEKQKMDRLSILKGSFKWLPFPVLPYPERISSKISSLASYLTPLSEDTGTYIRTRFYKGLPYTDPRTNEFAIISTKLFLNSSDPESWLIIEGYFKLDYPRNVEPLKIDHAQIRQLTIRVMSKSRPALDLPGDEQISEFKQFLTSWSSHVESYIKHYQDESSRPSTAGSDMGHTDREEDSPTNVDSLVYPSQKRLKTSPSQRHLNI